MKGWVVKNLSLKSNRKQAARYDFCILQPVCVGGGSKNDCGSIDKLI